MLSEMLTIVDAAAAAVGNAIPVLPSMTFVAGKTKTYIYNNLINVIN